MRTWEGRLAWGFQLAAVSNYRVVQSHSGPTLLGAMDELAPATKMLAETRRRPLRLFVTDVTQVRGG